MFVFLYKKEIITPPSCWQSWNNTLIGRKKTKPTLQLFWFFKQNIPNIPLQNFLNCDDLIFYSVLCDIKLNILSDKLLPRNKNNEEIVFFTDFWHLMDHRMNQK